MECSLHSKIFNPCYVSTVAVMPNALPHRFEPGSTKRITTAVLLAIFLLNSSCAGSGEINGAADGSMNSSKVNVTGHAYFLPGPCGTALQGGLPCFENIENASNIELVVYMQPENINVAEIKTKYDGSFALSLQPDQYSIELKHSSMNYMLRSSYFVVNPNQTTHLQIGIDLLRP